MNNKTPYSIMMRAVCSFLTDAGNAAVWMIAKLLMVSTVMTLIAAVIGQSVMISLILTAVSVIALIGYSVWMWRLYDIQTQIPKLSIWSAVSVIMVIMQIALSIGYMELATNALYRIRFATRVYDSGVLTAAAPYESFIGVIGYVLGIHPAVLSVTVMAVLIISASYGAYRSLVRAVFGTAADKKHALFIVFSAVWFINLYGYQSDRALTMTLLTGYYTFECLLIHVILPMVCAFLITLGRCWAESGENSAETMADNGDSDVSENDLITDDEYQEEWDMKKHKIINARNLAIALGVLTVLLLAFVYILNSKINTLYDATVNMQNELNSSCKTYEFAPNGITEGYVIKNTDGSISVIGGGDIQNAQALSDMIKSYSDTVDSWYLYGDEDEAGAYEGCLQNGISVKNVHKLK